MTTNQPIHDYNDGSGYWYTICRTSTGYVYSVRGDDDAVIESARYSLDTKREAIACARNAIRVWRSAV